MKRVLKALLSILIVLVVIVSAVLLWQWKNIQGIVIGVSENQEDIKKRREDNQTTLVEDVNKILDEPLRDFTEEEKTKIKEGSLSVSEVYQQLFEERQAVLSGEIVGSVTEQTNEGPVIQNEADEVVISANSSETEENNSEQPQNSDTVEKEESSEKPQQTASMPGKDEIVSRYMSELYRLQNEFTGRAEALIAEGANYYESTNTRPQDPVARANTIKKYTPIVRGIESECDAKVEAVIANLKNELEAIGADTSIIATIRKTYANEKQLKLSYYANKYLK